MAAKNQTYIPKKGKAFVGQPKSKVGLSMFGDVDMEEHDADYDPIEEAMPTMGGFNPPEEEAHSTGGGGGYTTFKQQAAPTPRHKPEEFGPQMSDGERDLIDSAQYAADEASLLSQKEKPNYGQIGSRLAFAQGLMKKGEKPIEEGAGWVGALEKLTNQLGGAYLQGRALDQKSEMDTAANKSIRTQLASGGGSDAAGRYIQALEATGRPEDLQKAQELREFQLKESMKGTNDQPIITGGTNGPKQISYDKGRTWQPIPGTEARKLPGSGADGTRLEPETLKLLAEQYIASGDTKLFVRLSKDDAAALRNVIAQTMTDNGYTARQVAAAQAEMKAFTSGLQSLAGRQANIDSAVAEARDMSKLAADMSAKVPRGKFVPINKVRNDWETLNSNPQLAQLVFYATSTAGAMATVAGRGTPNQFLQEKFMHMLGTATSHETFMAQMEAVRTEAFTIMRSTESVRDHMVDTYTRGAGSIGAKPGGGSHGPEQPAGAPFDPKAAPINTVHEGHIKTPQGWVPVQK